MADEFGADIPPAFAAAGLEREVDWSFAVVDGLAVVVINQSGLTKLLAAIETGAIPGRTSAAQLWRERLEQDETFRGWSGLT